MYPLLNLRLGIVAEQPPRLRNVCKGLRHIAWLQRLLLDDGVLVQFPLKQRNQLPQINRARLAEINDFVVTIRVIDRCAHAGDDVINVGVVTTRQAIAENRDRFSRADQTSEFVDGEIGSLPRAIYREKAQADAADA